MAQPAVSQPTSFEEFVTKEELEHDPVKGWVNKTNKEKVFFSVETFRIHRQSLLVTDFKINLSEISSFQVLKTKFMAKANKLAPQIETLRADLRTCLTKLEGMTQTVLGDDEILAKTAQFVKDNLIYIYKKAILEVELGGEELLQLSVLVETWCQQFPKFKSPSFVAHTPAAEQNAMLLRLLYKINSVMVHGFAKTLTSSTKYQDLAAWKADDRDFSSLVVEQALRLVETNTPSNN